MRGIASIHLAKEVTEQIDAGKLTWNKFGGVHPARMHEWHAEEDATRRDGHRGTG